MKPTPVKYWFPARRFGWGWGLPNRRPGWLVLAAYVGLFVLGVVTLGGRASPAAHVGFVSLITAALLLICWKKGEPPRWRWGGE